METGEELYEVSGEVEMEWRIKLLLPLKTTDSPSFYFAGTSWKFILCSHLDARRSKFSVGLMRLSSNSLVRLKLTVAVKTAKGEKHPLSKETYTYDRDKEWCMLISDVPPMIEFYKPCTLIFTLMVKDSHNITNSLFKRLTVLSNDFRNLQREAKDTDLTLNVKGEKFPVHRVIFESRSKDAFSKSTKFARNLKEKETEELTIDGVNPSSMRIISNYIYTGDTDSLDEGNVFSTYIAAEQFEMKELKMICLEFIRQNLTVDWLFDVMKFADQQKAEEVAYLAVEYFVENVTKIIKTNRWKSFSRECKDRSIELLTMSVTKNLEN